MNPLTERTDERNQPADDAETVSRSFSSVGSLALALLIAALATLPFLDKAFHIDDVLYLRVAEQILRTPWDPYGESERAVVLWDSENGRPASLYRTDFNPPLWKYVLAGAIYAFGLQEWKLHLVSAVTVAIAAMGLWAVGRQLTTRPLWCVAMILWSPFFLPGQNLMLEVPVLAFSAWATYFQIRSFETRSVWDALVAGLLVGLAICTKYSAGLLIPVFVLGSLLYRRAGSLRFLVTAIAVLGAWTVHNFVIYGEAHLTSHGVMFKPNEWPSRALLVLRLIGAVSVLWPIYVSCLWRRGGAGRIGLVCCLGASAALAWLDLQQANAGYAELSHVPILIHQLHFVVFTFFGSLTVTALTVASSMDARKDWQGWRQDASSRWLEVWIAALCAFNVCCVPFNAVRHMLLAFVPLTYLTATRIPAGSRRLPVAVLLVSTGLGVILAASDYEVADNYRTFARTELRKAVALHPTVWFTGHWGWVFYASQEGAKPYFEGTDLYGLGRPQPGDRVYNPLLVNWRGFDSFGLPVEWREPSQPVGQIPIRTLLPGTNYYGQLPYVLPWSCIIIPPHPEEGLEGYRMPPLETFLIYDFMPPGRGAPAADSIE